MPGDPVVGSTVLRRPAIQSPNFVHASAGWSIAADGTAEFNSVTIRGSFEAGTDPGPNVQIDTFGELLFFDSAGNLVMVMNPAKKAYFIYSPGGGSGNLTSSYSNASGTDAYGNHVLSGSVSYGEAEGTATQLDSGGVTLYTGSLAGGWTAQGQVLISPAGVIELLTAAGVITSNNTLDNGAGGATFNGNVTVTGTLSVNGSGSTSTNGLPNGGITGTSGGASAGTAHTHGPGSFSVSNGQHAHTL